MDQPVVFMSYARNDNFGPVVRQKLEVLLRHPLERYGVRLFVDDDVLRAGDALTKEIVHHANLAVVGVLLVNPAFYASRYVQEVEYPLLTKRAATGMASIVPILVEDCLWQHDPVMSQIVFANDVTVPLIELRDDSARLSRVLSQVAARILERAVGRATAIETPDLPSVSRAGLPGTPAAPPGPGPELGDLHGVPTVPRVVLARTAEVERIWQELLATGGRGQGALGLFGPAGIGKTVLASMVVTAEPARTAFPDGIYWITVGESADPVHAQTALCTLLGDTPVFRNRRDGRARLIELLRDKRCLVVIDDVWAGDQLQALLVTGPSGATLVTTRKRFILDTAGVPARRIESLSVPEARELLAAAAGLPSPDALPAEGDRIVSATEGVALAVMLVGSAMKHGRRGAEVAAHLETDVFGDHPYANAFKAMTLATATLDASHLERYRRMAVFPPDTDVPVAVVEHWWRHLDGLTPAETLVELRELASLELIELTSTAGAQTVRLHDLKHDFLLYDVSDPLPMLHGELVDSFAQLLADGGWGELPVTVPYIWDWLVHHTRAAGRFVAPFVTEPAYIVKRLWVSGARAAESDLLVAAQEEHQRAAEADRLARLVARVGHLLAGLPTLAFTAASFRVWSSTLDPPIGLDSVLSLLPPLGLVPALPMPGIAEAQLRVLEGHESWVLAADFSPDGQYVGTGSADGTVRVWRTATGEQLCRIRGRGAVHAVAFCAGGRLMAIGSSDGSVELWSWPSVHRVGALPVRALPVTNIVARSDDRRLATAGEDGLRLFELVAGGGVELVAECSDPVRSVAFSPDGRMLATAGEEGMRLFELVAGGEVELVAESSDPAWSVAFATDGRFFATSGEDGTVKLAEVGTGAQVSVLRGHTDWVRAVRYSPEGGYLVTVSDDGTARVWDTKVAGQLSHDRAHDDWVRGVSFSPDGRLLATASDDGTARLWQVADGRQVMVLNGHRGRVLSVAFAPDGQLVATTCSDGLVRIWHTRTGELRTEYRGHTDWIRDASFSTDGKYLATASDDGTARLWNMADGAEVLVLPHRAARVRAVSFSPNGKQLVTAGTDGVTTVWDPVTGRPNGILAGHEGRVRHVRVSPDGSLVATAGDDGTTRLFDLASGAEVAVLGGHAGRVRAVAFSADGELLATADSGGTIRIWATAYGEQLVAVRVARSLRAVAFSRNGLSLAAGGDNAWFLFDVVGHAAHAGERVK